MTLGMPELNGSVSNVEQKSLFISIMFCHLDRQSTQVKNKKMAFLRTNCLAQKLKFEK